MRVMRVDQVRGVAESDVVVDGKSKNQEAEWRQFTIGSRGVTQCPLHEATVVTNSQKRPQRRTVKRVDGLDSCYYCRR